MKIYQILDLIILVLVIQFFIGMLGSSFPGISPDIIFLSIPDSIQTFLDILIYPIIALLIIDLSLKYKETKNPKKFVKKYWIDIFMLGLIPIFAIIKFLKIGVTILKQLKAIKIGTKVIHKTKKITKK